MHGGGFRRQIVDHVLPVLPHALVIVQGLAVEGDSDSVRPVADIEILRTNSPDDPYVTNLNAVRIRGLQLIPIGRQHWNISQHRH